MAQEWVELVSRVDEGRGGAARYLVQSGLMPTLAVCAAMVLRDARHHGRIPGQQLHHAGDEDAGQHLIDSVPDPGFNPVNRLAAYLMRYNPKYATPPRRLDEPYREYALLIADAMRTTGTPDPAEKQASSPQQTDTDSDSTTHYVPFSEPNDCATL